MKIVIIYNNIVNTNNNNNNNNMCNKHDRAIIMFNIQYQYSIVVIINERNALGICVGEVRTLGNRAPRKELQLDELRSKDEFYRKLNDKNLNFCDDMFDDMFKNFALTFGLDSWSAETLPPRYAIEEMKNDLNRFRVLGPITHSRDTLNPKLWDTHVPDSEKTSHRKIFRQFQDTAWLRREELIADNPNFPHQHHLEVMDFVDRRARHL